MRKRYFEYNTNENHVVKKQNKTIGCKNSRECKREKKNTSVRQRKRKYTYKIRSQRTIFSSTTYILKISNRQQKSSCSQSVSLSHRFILIFFICVFFSSLAHLFFVYNMRFFASSFFFFDSVAKQKNSQQALALW